jgi:hypothetical protein
VDLQVILLLSFAVFIFVYTCFVQRSDLKLCFEVFSILDGMTMLREHGVQPKLRILQMGKRHEEKQTKINNGRSIMLYSLAGLLLHVVCVQLEFSFFVFEQIRLLKNAVFWDVAPCGFIINKRFGGRCRLHLHGRKNNASDEQC